MDKSIRILIVDDFYTMRRIITNLLEDLGYRNTEVAGDGETALARLRSEDFDFLITDWNMPGMDGIELLRAVRADPALESLPVLMMTAEAEREQLDEATRAGVNAYVIKPFTAATLEDRIRVIFTPVRS